MEVVLSVQDLGISFGSNNVLKSVNYELYPNEVLGVIGPNGAGKTVMLDLLTGILRPTKGKIIFQGTDITQEKITKRCHLGLGRTFQIPKSFEQMTVFENIIVGGVYGNGLSERNAKKKAWDILETIGLADKKQWLAGKLGLLDRKRLEIGRAMATEAKVLLFDEVAGGLIESEVYQILEIVKPIKAQGKSIIWIEHVLQTMLEGADRVLCLAEGRDLICGKPIEVLESKEVAECYLGADEL